MFLSQLMWADGNVRLTDVGTMGEDVGELTLRNHTYIILIYIVKLHDTCRRQNVTTIQQSDWFVLELAVWHCVEKPLRMHGTVMSRVFSWLPCLYAARQQELFHMCTISLS